MDTARTTYALLAVSTGFFVFTMIMVGPTLFAEAIPSSQNVSASVSHVLAPNAFSDVPLRARAAVVYDVTSDTILYEKDANTPLPLASVTKIVSALVLKDALIDTPRVTIDPDALHTDGDSGLLAHELWNTDDLLSFSLVVSSNDGMEALQMQAEEAHHDSIIARMNTYTHGAGWTSFSFKNTTGLDIENTDGIPIEPSGVGSARDVARFFAHALVRYPTLYEATAEAAHIYTLPDDSIHTATNTNIARGVMPGLVASKTGYTDLAGGNLAIAFEPEPGRRIIVVVLGSTTEDRFTDVETLVARTLKQLWFQQ